jgi:hypothetical protein
LLLAIRNIYIWARDRAFIIRLYTGYNYSEYKISKSVCFAT